MTENSRKRARKSKLEVREGVDLEEGTLLYLQINEEIERKTEIQSGDNINSDSFNSKDYKPKPAEESSLVAETPLLPSQMDSIENATSVVKTEIDSSIDVPAIKSETDTSDHVHPLVSAPKPPMQFSVKIEVEECDDIATDENHDNYATPMTDNDSRVTNADMSAGVVTVDATTSNIFKPTIKPKTLVTAKATQCYNINVNTQNAQMDTGKKFTEYVTNKLMIQRITEKLIRSTKTADRILAKETRNYVGRVLDEPKLDVRDRVLQNIFEQWKLWYEMNTAVRSSPLLYKCYSCGLSWWHMYEFKEHISRHLRTINFQLDLEEENDECYIVYIQCNPFKKIIKFPLSDCQKCDKPAKDHVFANKMSYKCLGCKESFFTCYQLSLHEMKCKHKKKLVVTEGQSGIVACDICKCGFYTESTLYKHLRTTHEVRSDVVMPWHVNKCKFCLKTFILAPLHTCEKRTNNYGCNYCGRSFQKKIYKEIHVNNYHEAAKCRLCDKELMAICMEPSHMLQHTQKFALMYKCIECTEGRYYPDESSIKYHTQTVHSRPFEKKFKYLEMVILPKLCLEKSPVPNYEDDQKIAQVVAEVAVGNNQSLLKKSKPQSTRALPSMPNVTVKEEPADSCADAIETLYFADLPEVKEEKDIKMAPHIQISSIRTLRDLITVEQADPVHEVPAPAEDGRSEGAASAEDVVILEPEADVISVPSSAGSDDSDGSSSAEPSRKKYTGVVRKQLAKYVCRCGYVGIHSRMKAHKQQCGEVRAMRAARRRRALAARHTDSEDDGDKALKASDDSQEQAEQDDAGSGDGAAASEDEVEDGRHDSDQSWSASCGDSRRKRRKIAQYTCKCKRFKGNYLEYKRHREECAPARAPRAGAVACSKCRGGFDTFLRYANHFHRAHGHQRHACPQCLRRFDNLGRMAAHLMMHVNKQFLKTRTIRDSMQGTRLNTCKDCYNTFEPKDYLKHWETHLEIRVEKEQPAQMLIDAEDNMEGLYSAEVLRRALNSLQCAEAARGREGAGRRCVVCARQFARVNDCKRHTVEHLLADAFVRKPQCRALRCQLCGERFVRADTYKHHMREHALLPLYRCELCAKSFSDSSNFSKHKKVHNLSVYRCLVCDKKFHNAQSLDRHMELHETTKPLVCARCARVFYTQSALNKHVRSAHEKHRARFHCPVCRRPFPRLRDKWEHMWLAHRERKYQADCPLCERQYRRFADLKAHVREAHERCVLRLPDEAPRLVCAQPRPGARCACCPPPAGSAPAPARGAQPPAGT